MSTGAGVLGPARVSGPRVQYPMNCCYFGTIFKWVEKRDEKIRNYFVQGPAKSWPGPLCVRVISKIGNQQRRLFVYVVQHIKTSMIIAIVVWSRGGWSIDRIK